MNQSHKTALTRKRLSAPYCAYVELIGPKHLDYGCGHGSDVRILEGYIHTAVGYDPYQPDFSSKPREKFDTIMCQYVFNVIEDEAERIATIQHIARLLRKRHGRAFIVTRTKKEIDEQAQKKGWVKCGDGYKSRQFKNGSYQFQRGWTGRQLKMFVDLHTNLDSKIIDTGKWTCVLIGTF